MASYQRHLFLLMATDPVHVGTGGYRLGRVDNSIVREPGTWVPKIPGSSLHGVARSYAARLYETVEAAGADHSPVADPDRNPVCYTFGYVRRGGDGEGHTAYSGVVSIFDAQIVLFPVHSAEGPVWVSTRDRLGDCGFGVDGVPEDWPDGTALLSWERSDPLNLGWLMVQTRGPISVSAPAAWEGDEHWKAVRRRVVLIRESLFSHVVNGNLEVRTSVAINPKTGAADERKLFTYEAIPRGTFLAAEVALDDYREGMDSRPFPVDKTKLGNPIPGGRWTNPMDVVRAGFRMMEWLGVGGMGTRGFGRIRVVGEALSLTLGEEGWR